MKKTLTHFIGKHLKVYLAYSRDRSIRFSSASGGVATTLLEYLLEKNYIDAVVVPRPRFRQGFVYGVWTVVRDPSEILKFSGSLYAPVFGLSKVLAYALNRFKRIAVTAIPCHARTVRKISEFHDRNEDVFIIGLYCNNTPSSWATKYALKYFGIKVEEAESVKPRGLGWPGYTIIKTKTSTICIPFSLFWGSGFGQYFYGLGCYLCVDHTNTSADISLADPWTLPHEHIRRLGGATLVIVRSRQGLEVFENAVRSGYISAVEVDPIYAVQYATLLTSSKRGLGRNVGEPVLPPGFTTIIHELVYNLGQLLASRESLWPLLRVYHGIVRPLAFKIGSLFDYKLGTTWAKVSEYIRLMQKVKLPDKGLST